LKFHLQNGGNKINNKMKKDILNELDNTRNDVLIIKPNNQQTLYKRDDILAENLSQIFFFFLDFYYFLSVF